MPVEQAMSVVLEQLKQEGFGVLMDLDIQSTMKQKMAVELAPIYLDTEMGLKRV